MNETKNYKMCPLCDGTGVHSKIDPHTGEVSVEDPCVNCSGVGYFEEGKIDITDIMDELDWIHKKIKKILTKFEIPE